jgi:hypothetical protein
MKSFFEIGTEQFGPEFKHPWEYIAGYANSCNY